MKSRLLKVLSTYLRDFIVITLSVTLAFWVENYRDSQKAATDTKALLRKIQSDLHSQDQYLSFISEYANIHSLRFDSLITDLDDSRVEMNQLMTDVSIAYIPYVSQVSHSSAFEALKNSGLLSNIENDSIITSIYDIEARIKATLFAYNEEWKLCQTRLQVQIAPFYGRHIKFDFTQSRLVFHSTQPVILPTEVKERITFEITRWITMMKQYSIFVNRHREELHEIVPMLERELQ